MLAMVAVRLPLLRLLAHVEEIEVVEGVPLGLVEQHA
jgi:hypothetical protein